MTLNIDKSEIFACRVERPCNNGEIAAIAQRPDVDNGDSFGVEFFCFCVIHIHLSYSAAGLANCNQSSA